MDYSALSFFSQIDNINSWPVPWWLRDMSTAKASSRSFEIITKADLRRLGQIAACDRADLFRRKPDTARLYSDRLFAVALCQGAARHFVDPNSGSGVNDLDVWSFLELQVEDDAEITIADAFALNAQSTALQRERLYSAVEGRRAD